MLKTQSVARARLTFRLQKAKLRSYPATCQATFGRGHRNSSKKSPITGSSSEPCKRSAEINKFCSNWPLRVFSRPSKNAVSLICALIKPRGVEASSCCVAPIEGDRGGPCRSAPPAHYPGWTFRGLDTTSPPVTCGLDLCYRAQITRVKWGSDPKRTGHGPAPFCA